MELQPVQCLLFCPDVEVWYFALVALSARGWNNNITVQYSIHNMNTQILFCSTEGLEVFPKYFQIIGNTLLVVSILIDIRSNGLRDYQCLQGLSNRSKDACVAWQVFEADRCMTGQWSGLLHDKLGRLSDSILRDKPIFRNEQFAKQSWDYLD